MRTAIAVILSVAVLFSVSSCTSDENQAQQNKQRNFASVSVDFSKLPAAAPDIRFTDGQPVQLSNATLRSSTLFTGDGFLTFTPLVDGKASAYGSSPDLGSPVTTEEARWSFGAPGGAFALNVSHGAFADTGIPRLPFAMRFVATTQSWFIGVWGPKDAEISIITTGNFNPPLATETELSTKIWIVDNWITAILPNGQRVAAKDSRVSMWHGSYANFELHTDTGEADSVPRLIEFSASTQPELPPAEG